MLRNHPQFRANAQANRAEGVVNNLIARVSDDENQIALFQFELACERGFFRIAEKFRGRRLKLAPCLDFDPEKSLRRVACRVRRQIVEILAREFFGLARHDDRANGTRLPASVRL